MQHTFINKLPIALRYYMRHAWQYPRWTSGWLIAVPLTTLVNGYLPAIILARVLNQLSRGQYDARHLWHSFGSEIIIYFGLLFSGLLLWRLVDFYIWRLEQRMEQDIAEEVFDHLLSRSTDFHANNFGGSLVSQTTKLMGGYLRVQDTTVFQVYPLASGIVITIAILLPRAPLYAIGLLVFSGLFLLVAIRLSRQPTKHLQAYAATESKQTGLLADAVSNVSVIKSFAGRQIERTRFHKATSNTRQHLQRYGVVQQRQIMGLGIMTRLISSFAFVAAIISVAHFHANIATMFLILNFTSSIVEQLFQFSNNSLRNYNRAFGDAKEMATTLTQTPEILDPLQPEASHMQRGAIAFNEVAFEHSGAGSRLFSDFKLDIAAGEKIGLVGHSGSGKTTLTRLLLRFSDIQAGTITIDGQNIAAVTQDDLHQAIAYVPQEPLLFHRSINDNIAYGQHGASMAAIKKAARQAHAAEFINQLTEGYDTLVGERGVKLSGGQRQRIAIARAMLKNAPVLVLDEATSALDSESEVLIQDALWKLMEGRTAIVIAHRLSTIQKMDRILVLAGGKIVEQGSHAELLKLHGTYAALWSHQSGGFIDEDE